MKLFKTLVLSGTLAATCASLSGAVIGGWINDGTDDPFPMSATTVDSIVESATATRGAGTNSNTFGAGTNGLIASGFNQGTVADAISNGDYIGFSFDFGSDQLDFETFTGYAKSQSASANVYLFSDLTGGFVDGEEIAMFTPTTTQNGAQGDLWTVDLGSIPEMSAVTGTVEFRAYFVGDAGFNHQGFRGPNDMSDMDVYFEGVVPEPSTYAMIAGALALGIALIRRRR